MHSLSDDFAQGVLLEQQGPHLSLYQPTHRHRPENQQDPIRFRNLVKRLEDSLQQKYAAGDVRELVDPYRALAEDPEFWNHTQLGLAVLAAPGFFRVYRLLRPVPELAVVAGSFHLKPLLRIVQSADRFHVLAIDRQAARMFEGNRDALKEIAMVPGARTRSEALGDEHTEPHSTVASYGGPGGGGLAKHHGHGSRKDEIDLDTERYFRAVDRVVLEHYSRPSGLPLVLASLTEHQTPFRRVSQNPSLLDEGVAGDPGAVDTEELCARAWRVVEPQYLAKLAGHADRFLAARAKGLGSDDVAAVAGAALGGRVGTLLLEADCVVPGRIDHQTGAVQTADLHHPDVNDVLDDVGELVMRAKGEVVVVPADRMPTGTGLAAIYRF